MKSSAPFSPMAALALVAAGAALLVAILWMIGAGVAMGDLNDGGAHSGGRGLNGYAGLYRLLETTGHDTLTARDKAAQNQPGLLILTPPPWSDGADIEQLAQAHQPYGPVLVITPKWLAEGVSPDQPGVARGWVRIDEVKTPEWQGFLDDVRVTIAPARAPVADSRGARAILPYPAKVMSGSGAKLVPLVRDGAGRMLAASYAGRNLALIFEPDLANNAGFAHEENARITLAMIEAMLPAGQRRVIFDLTLNGLGRKANLLTLAFTPPYLAVTLALILAGAAVLWRAYARFGPPLAPERDMAFGKGALAENAAGLIARARRYHLLPGPYADAARGRIAAALGLPPHGDPAMLDAAIKRALAARAPDHSPAGHSFAERGPAHPNYAETAAALRAARRPVDILRAARRLHALEQILTR